MNKTPQKTSTLPRWVSHVPWVALLIGHAPLLIAYFQQVWREDHYRFIPFSLIGVAWLAWSRFDRKTPRVHTWFWLIGLCVSAVLLAVATLIPSTWLAAVSAVMAAAAELSTLTDKKTRWQLTYLSLPLILVVRLPLLLDNKLIAELQSITSVWAGYGLRMLGILHLSEGNVLEVPGKTFFVEEACSGVQSVFTLLCLSSLFAAWFRRRITRAALLIASSIFWAVVMNVVRVMVIAFAYDRWKLDLSSGWIHEVLGYFALSVALLLLFSTDRFLYFIFAPIPHRKDQPSNPFVVLWNTALSESYRPGTPEPRSPDASGSYYYADAYYEDDEAPSEPAKPLFFGRRLGSLAQPAAVVVAGLFFCLGIGGMVKAGQSPAKPSLTIVELDRDALSAEYGDAVCGDYGVERRKRSSALGQYSNEWNYDAPWGELVVSVDQPFTAWHDLTVCYTGLGWKLLESSTIESVGDKELKWPCTSALFTKKGQFAYLFFSEFDHNDRPRVAPNTGLAKGLWERLLKSAAFQSKTGLGVQQVYQVQAFLITDKRLVERDLSAMQSLHLKTRRDARKAILSRAATGGEGR